MQEKSVPTKTVALFGGSFNPPHSGHFEAASYIAKTLKPDEIWMLFSVNPLKDPAKYAPLEERLEMGRIAARHYPDLPVVLSDEEEDICRRMPAHQHETFFVLKELQKAHPDCRFVWVMGADNLIGFENWSHADEIFENFSIAVLGRPGYNERALASATAQKFAALRRNGADDLDGGPGWTMLDNPPLSLSSTAVLEKARQGETDFDPATADVIAYCRKRGLYGLKPPNPPAPVDKLRPPQP